MAHAGLAAKYAAKALAGKVGGIAAAAARRPRSAAAVEIGAAPSLPTSPNVKSGEWLHS